MNFAYLLPFLTFALGIAIQMLVGGRKVAETIFTEHLADIATLRSEATDYWLSDGTETIAGTILQAAKVQVALATVTAFAPVAARHFDDKSLDQYDLVAHLSDGDSLSAS